MKLPDHWQRYNAHGGYAASRCDGIYVIDRTEERLFYEMEHKDRWRHVEECKCPPNRVLEREIQESLKL